MMGALRRLRAAVHAQHEFVRETNRLPRGTLHLANHGHADDSLSYEQAAKNQYDHVVKHERISRIDLSNNVGQIPGDQVDQEGEGYEGLQ